MRLQEDVRIKEEENNEITNLIIRGSFYRITGWARYSNIFIDGHHGVPATKPRASKRRPVWTAKDLHLELQVGHSLNHD